MPAVRVQDDFALSCGGVAWLPRSGTMFGRGQDSCLACLRCAEGVARIDVSVKTT